MARDPLATSCHRCAAPETNSAECLRRSGRMRQSRVAQHLAEAKLLAQWRRWLARRLRMALGRDAFGGDIELCWVRIRASFCSLPTVVGMAVLRVVSNEWPARCRIGGMPRGCACGCAV